MNRIYECPNCGTQCGARDDWQAHYHILWANGYGQEVRVFCRLCGQWSDNRYLNKNGVITSRVVRPAQHKFW